MDDSVSAGATRRSCPVNAGVAENVNGHTHCIYPFPDP